MKKIKLGSNPKNFKKTIDIVLLDGDTAPLEITFKYRTRREFAVLVDTNIQKAEAETKAAAKAAEDEANASDKKDDEAPRRLTIEESYAAVDKARAEHVLQIADGWDLDNPFNLDTLLQFEDEYPGALQAIAVKYAEAVAEARTKN